MTTEYAKAQLRQYDIIELTGENWKPVPGLSPTIAASADGILNPSFGPGIRYHPRYGLYVPVADERVPSDVLMPVHLLVAAAWLSAPDHLSDFELRKFMHSLVVHKDGNKLNNRPENLAWSDCPGEGSEAFYRWLMKAPPWTRTPRKTA